MKMITLKSITILTLMTLVGCGGGGSDSGDNNVTPSPPPVPDTTKKTFTIQLVAIDASQVSSKETINIEMGNISHSGTVTFKQ